MPPWMSEVPGVYMLLTLVENSIILKRRARSPMEEITFGWKVKFMILDEFYLVGCFLSPIWTLIEPQ